jgi:hypothetical protein
MSASQIPDAPMEDMPPLSDVEEMPPLIDDTPISAPKPIKGISDSGKVRNLEELKKEAPEIYQMMLRGIATNICNEMKAQQERLKKIIREARANARG